MTREEIIARIDHAKEQDLEAVFENENLSGFDFCYMSLEGADFEGADVSGCIFDGCDLSGASFSFAVARKPASFVCADLTRADFSYSRLRGADFTRADFKSTDLRFADLSRARLVKADLREADARQADLRHTDLRWARISGHLIGADTEGATY